MFFGKLTWINAIGLLLSKNLQKCDALTYIVSQTCLMKSAAKPQKDALLRTGLQQQKCSNC